MIDSIYLVGPERQVLELFNPLWGEIRLEPQRFVNAESAIEDMKRGGRPKAVLISYPLWDTTLEEVIRGIRNSGSSDDPVPTFVVAPEAAISEVGTFEDMGVTILSEGEDGPTLRSRVKDGLFPEQRAAQRVVVRMEVHLGSGKLLRLCQSENVSVSGMLIRTNEEYPIGSAIGVEFVLPGEEEPICGTAVIVRYTDPGVERTRGMGVKFAHLEEDGFKRLERFVG